MAVRQNTDKGIPRLHFALTPHSSSPARFSASVHPSVVAMAELLQELRISHEGAFLDAALSEADLDVQLEVVGAVIMKTYEASRNIELLEDVIRVYAQVLLLRPGGHGGRVAALKALGLTLMMSCEGSHADKARLIRSISCHWEALGHRPPGHPDRANTLFDLGRSFLTFHVLYSDDDALSGAVGIFREALEFCPTMDQISRAHLLRELSRALQTQFRRQHDSLDILIEALDMSREALTLLPADDPDRTTSLSDLAIAHLTLYHEQGNFDALEEAIELFRHSLDLRPPGHPTRFNALSNLASTLRVRFDQRGESDVLVESIGLLRQAVDLCPQGHPTRGRVLNNLADALHTRFEQCRDPEASSEATGLYRGVLDLRPLGHPDRHAALNNLAMSLSVQFKQQGNSQALTEAIALHRQALALLPPGHPSYGTSLDNLAAALMRRSKEQGDTDALTEAISLLRRAFELNPSRGSTLNNLAAALYARFMDRENDSDISALAEVIDLNRQALSLSSHHNPTHHAALNNLANALQARTEQDGDLHTLIEVIDLHRQALRLRPPSHFMRPSTLRNLGLALRLLYLTQPTVLEEELALAREGVEICGDGHPMQAYFLFAVGACLLRPGTPLFDSESGIRYIIQSLENPVSPARERLRLAIPFLRFMDDIYCAESAEAEVVNNAPILDLYVRTIRLLPYVASVGRGHAFRLRELAVAEEISRNAATRALLVGRKSDAVEMLEEGRGVFWSQALRIRSTALSTLPADDRDRLYNLLKELETGSHTEESTMLDTAGRERLLEKRSRLGETIEAMIASIRQRPGLERFLMPPAYSSLLQLLPHHGFVVMLVASKLGNDALILNSDQNDARTLKLSAPPGEFVSQSIHTALPRDGRGTDSPASSLDLRALERALKISRESKKKVTADPFEEMLGALWTFIVKPVIDALELQVS
jgi:tetratricopeptide (TPR) repeat protein